MEDENIYKVRCCDEGKRDERRWGSDEEKMSRDQVLLMCLPLCEPKICWVGGRKRRGETFSLLNKLKICDGFTSLWKTRIFTKVDVVMREEKRWEKMRKWWRENVKGSSVAHVFTFVWTQDMLAWRKKRREETFSLSNKLKICDGLTSSWKTRIFTKFDVRKGEGRDERRWGSDEEKMLRDQVVLMWLPLCEPKICSDGGRKRRGETFLFPINLQICD